MKTYDSFETMPLFEYTSHNCGCCGKYIGELSQMELDALALGEITGYCDECEMLRCVTCGEVALYRKDAFQLHTKAECESCEESAKYLSSPDRAKHDWEKWQLHEAKEIEQGRNALQAWLARDFDAINRRRYRMFFAKD